MNFRDLQYFIALVDYAHFGKAADACFVSQPALSMQIKKLEDTLGVSLIERQNKTFMLTEVGQSLVVQAREILGKMDTLKETATYAKDPYSGELRLGVIPTLGPYLLPHITPGLSKAFPQLTTYLVEEQTAKLVLKVKQAKLDAALIALPVMDNDLVALPLFEEEFLLAVPNSDPLTKCKTIKPADLDEKPLLLLEDGHCMRDQALSFCQQIRAAEVQKFQATSLETLRHMVAAHAGITLMPKLSCRLNDGVSYLPFHSSPKPSRTVGLIFRQTSAKRILLQDLAEQIKKLMNKQKLVKTID
jgi:LysR family hydrogen peroxide-inducible transcriptional activator